MLPKREEGQADRTSPYEYEAGTAGDWRPIEVINSKMGCHSARPTLPIRAKRVAIECPSPNLSGAKVARPTSGSRIWSITSRIRGRDNEVPRKREGNALMR